MENISSLNMFEASSVGDEQNKRLWVKGASLFIGQLNSLLQTVKYQLETTNISQFENENAEIFGQICKNNGTDKSTKHDYHILYSHIFNELGINNKLNILEIGLGTTNPTLISNMGIQGRTGASLYSFRNYLPHANIYGCDIDTASLFNEDRIRTCYVDQLNLTSFCNIKHSFGDIKYDLIIDDGLHAIGANFNTLLFALENVNDNGWIVIEDIEKIDNWRAIMYILTKQKNFKIWYVISKYAQLVCIKKISPEE